MNYIFRKTYKFHDPVPASRGKLVLLAEPEAEAAALYLRHLSGRPGFDVAACTDLAAAQTHLQALRPDLLIINPTADLALSFRFLSHITGQYPSLFIITLGYAIPDNYLDRFMRIGVSLHIDRRLTRPQDVAVAAEQVLYGINH